MSLTRRQAQAISRRYPGWSVWASNSGRVYAAHCRASAEMAALRAVTGTRWCGSGVTVSAVSAGLIGAAIEECASREALAA